MDDYEDFEDLAVETFEYAFAIDVGWLKEIDGLPEERQIDFARLELVVRLVEFVMAHDAAVLFDSEANIDAEYQRQLPWHSVGYAAWQRLSQYQYRYSSRPTLQVGRQLAQIDFDPSDRPYVAVANRGRGVYLTHESKHNHPDVRRAVRTGCGVEIIDSDGLSRILARPE
jgi:hypothetical protein